MIKTLKQLNNEISKPMQLTLYTHVFVITDEIFPIKYLKS